MKKSTTSPDAVPTAALNCFVGLFNQHLPLAVQLCERQMQPRLVDWNWWVNLNDPLDVRFARGPLLFLHKT
jgi:hypothetical protein